jgi:serine/threonine protein phosphatase PrpC
VAVVSNAESLRLESWGRTDVGMKRRLNEDVFMLDRDLGVYLVADGMGGHAAGEVASKMAAEEILTQLNADPGIEAFSHGTAGDFRDRVEAAVLAAHKKVTDAVERDDNLKGMGTTVVVAIHPPLSPTILICHVGDSRAYRLRGGHLQLLTDDHSWVHEQVAAGFLTEEAARSHPLKNVVTQALGGAAEPRVDILEEPMQPEDMYLLCSDGLNSMLTDEEISVLLQHEEPLEEKATRLIVAANQRGGNDNISVVILRAVATD